MTNTKKMIQHLKGTILDHQRMLDKLTKQYEREKIMSTRKPQGVPIASKYADVHEKLATIAQHYNYTFDDMMSKNRQAQMCDLRHAMMYYFCKQGFSYVAVGEMFGKEHATIMHAFHKIESYVEVRNQKIMDILKVIKATMENEQ